MSAPTTPLTDKDYEWLRWALDSAIQRGQTSGIQATLVALHQKLTTLQAQDDGLAARVEAYHGIKTDTAVIRSEVRALKAERKQLWKAAKGLRGAVRIALDEWHKFTDHLDDSIAIRDVLSKAYEDTAGMGL